MEPCRPFPSLPPLGSWPVRIERACAILHACLCRMPAVASRYDGFVTTAPAPPPAAAYPAPPLAPRAPASGRAPSRQCPVPRCDLLGQDPGLPGPDPRRDVRRATPSPASADAPRQCHGQISAVPLRLGIFDSHPGMGSLRRRHGPRSVGRMRPKMSRGDIAGVSLGVCGSDVVDRLR
ncbi:hypothetical protein BS78_05G088500 [Paspalum vaginatum]|nr:hypothetical protein BS78_05G088500 [Paspalum vaginatum]